MFFFHVVFLSNILFYVVKKRKISLFVVVNYFVLQLIEVSAYAEQHP